MNSRIDTSTIVICSQNQARIYMLLAENADHQEPIMNAEYI